MNAKLLALLVSGGVAACGPTLYKNMDADNDAADADLGPVPTPRVDALPMSIPYRIATIRGTAPDAYRVLVEGGYNPYPAPVITSGPVVAGPRPPSGSTPARSGCVLPAWGPG